MIKSNYRAAAMLKCLILSVAVSANALSSAHAADEPEARPTTKAGANLRLILHRQKGDVLKVYLNSRAAYVNGKSVAAASLPELVRASGLKQVVISAEPYLSEEKVARIEKLIRTAGVDDIERVAPPKPDSAEETLRLILHRQKGDQLKVHLNSRSAYVNGKSISTGMLKSIIRESGLDEVIISAAPYVSDKKVAGWEEIVREAGVKDIKRAAPRQPDGADETLRLILHRQKSDELKVYLNSRGAYINGKSISARSLPAIIRESGLDKAVISAEPYVIEAKVNGWEEAIRKAGVEDIEVTTPRAK